MASHIYPSFYNGGWVVKDPELDKTKDPDILDTIYRSRMIGLFGFGTINGTLPERVSLYPAEVLDAARRNIPIYKKYRHLLYAQAYHLFPPSGSPERWQAIQFSNGERSRGAMFPREKHAEHYASAGAWAATGGRYKVTTVNGAVTRSITGKRLMGDGLIALLPKPEMSNVFSLSSESR